MNTDNRPDPRLDPAGFIRFFTDETLRGSGSVADLWDAYYEPDSTNTTNQKTVERDKSIKLLQRHRDRGFTSDLRVLDTVVDGNLVAIRYVTSLSLIWKLNLDTEFCFFGQLSDAGRFSSTSTVSREGYSMNRDDHVWDSDAAPGQSPASATDGRLPSNDIGAYLTGYSVDSANDAIAADEVIDRYFSPDLVQEINGATFNRAEAIGAIEATRKKERVYETTIHETLKQGNSYAARYRTSPERRRLGVPEIEVYEFGSFAPDGRVREVRSIIQTLEGGFPG